MNIGGRRSTKSLSLGGDAAIILILAPLLENQRRARIDNRIADLQRTLAVDRESNLRLLGVIVSHRLRAQSVVERLIRREVLKLGTVIPLAVGRKI